MLRCVNGLGSHLVRVDVSSHTEHNYFHIFQCFPLFFPQTEKYLYMSKRRRKKPKIVRGNSEIESVLISNK